MRERSGIWLTYANGTGLSMARFLYSLPVQHYLAYGSCIAGALSVPGGQDARVTDGTPSANLDAIWTHDPDVFWSVGHGSPTEHTVECTESFIRTGDYPMGLGLVGGRVVQLLSCQCGDQLVPDLVSRGGADAAIGYTEDFTLGIKADGDPDPYPCEAPIPRADYFTFCDCDLEAQRALLNGKGVGDAVAASQRKSESEIERYETGDRSEWWIAPYVARELFVNKESQVLYESGRMPTVYAGLGLLSQMFMLSGIFLVGAIVYSKATTGEWALPW